MSNRKQQNENALAGSPAHSTGRGGFFPARSSMMNLYTVVIRDPDGATVEQDVVARNRSAATTLAKSILKEVWLDCDAAASTKFEVIEVRTA